MQSNRLLTERSQVRVRAGVAGEFYSLGSTFCADSFVSICSTLMLLQQNVKNQSFCQKCRWQVTAKHTYMYPIYVALNNVTQ